MHLYLVDMYTLLSATTLHDLHSAAHHDLIVPYTSLVLYEQQFRHFRMELVPQIVHDTPLSTVGLSNRIKNICHSIRPASVAPSVLRDG